MSLEPGETVSNRYRIVKILGQGGFGAVYRAWDTNFSMPCAVKENLETQPQAQRQFEREAKLLRTMKHPNLPLVTDYFILPDKGQYLVMDYVEGQDLQQIMEQNQAPLTEDQVLDWMSQICEALVYLHSQNPPIIHRDIKPANIRITPEGRAILVDFGIAKIFDPTLKTSTGARAVTPGYAPFEQYGQGKTDARTDIYGLGATMYTLLSGKPPVESVQRTVRDDLIPVEQLNPDLPPMTARIIHRAMEMDPEKRFQSAEEFQRALRSVDPVNAAIITPLAPTLVAPIVQPSEQPTRGSKSLARLGIFGGVGLLALGAIGVLIALFVVLFIVGNTLKPNSSQTDIPSATNTQDQAHLLITEQFLNTPAIAVSQTNPALIEVTPLELNQSSTPQLLGTDSFFTLVEKPADIPVMQAAKNLQTYQYQMPDADSIGVNFEIDATPQTIIDFYEHEMPANGWEKMTTYSDDKMAAVYFNKGNRMAVVMVTRSGDKILVTIQITEKS